MKKTVRSDELIGKTIKIKTGCGTLFITINLDDNGEIFEIFLNGSKLGGCRASQESVARLITLIFKYDIPVEAIIDQLTHISCPSCTRAKAKLADEKDVREFPTSCGDAVAKVLTRIIKSIKCNEEHKKT